MFACVDRGFFILGIIYVFIVIKDGDVEGRIYVFVGITFVVFIEFVFFRIRGL